MFAKEKNLLKRYLQQCDIDVSLADSPKHEQASSFSVQPDVRKLFPKTNLSVSYQKFSERRRE